MGNAHPQAKAVARRVIGSNDEDGLARFLEELVNKQSA
jgi:hydroxymethylpyrimidine pyrophosphatase-like HAD family hydrolase